MEDVLCLILEKSPKSSRIAKHVLMCLRSGSVTTQDRYNVAAKQALKAPEATFTDSERAKISSLINESPYHK